MISQLTYEQIIEKIKKEKGLSEGDITSRVNDKLSKLSDLISRHGAVHIVANELGVSVFEDYSGKDFKIEELREGMRNIAFNCKLSRIDAIRSFNKNGRAGRVANLIVGDDTQALRVVVWEGVLIDEISKGLIPSGTILHVNGGVVRQNNGRKEVHLGKGAKLEVSPKNISFVKVVEEEERAVVNKKIIELMDNDMNVGITGTIIQVFEPRFYESCSSCGKKVEVKEGKSYCNVHGFNGSAFVPILNLYFDDGTDNIRVTCFRENVDKVLGMTKDEVKLLKDDVNAFERIKNDINGKQFTFFGKVQKNEMFGRKEFMVNGVKEVDPVVLIREIEVRVP